MQRQLTSGCRQLPLNRAVLYQTYANVFFDADVLFFGGAQLSAVQRQLTLSLELLGAREEEIDDLRLTMEEQRGVFQAQVEALLVK